MSSITVVKNPSLDQTIAVMREKANEAKKTLRPLAARICADLEPGDYNSEIHAIYAWVCQNIRYARDIQDVEYVQAPARLIESKTGDCDDIACLLAALCMAMGNECRFLVVGFEDKQPSHVFCQVAVQTGQAGGGHTKGERSWVTVDPVAQENTAQMHSRVRAAQVYPVGTGVGGPSTGSFGHLGNTRGRASSTGSQTFSVFNPYNRNFDYYEAPGNSLDFGSRGTKHRELSQRPQGNKQLGYLGFAPEALAIALPEAAQRSGSGPEARGIMAWVPSGSGSGLSGVPQLIAPVLGAVEEVKIATSFGDMVLAASVAAVVGAFVQRALRGKK